jgi:RNA polymerase sigma factor (sigma-70 family)
LRADEDFTEYVGARWPRLVRSAVLLGCSTAEAEDIVQTALEKCLRRWSKVQAAGDRDAYVHRVLINAFISSRRRRWWAEKPTQVLTEQSVSNFVGQGQLWPEHLRGEDPGPDEMGRIDDADAVMRALDGLSQEQRTAVVLRFYAHLDERQMAAVLDVAPGTVKSRLSRALKNLAHDPNLAELRGTR